ncbi:glutamate receptor ionotropic, kainate 2-like [Glandiceps talaboti]
MDLVYIACLVVLHEFIIAVGGFESPTIVVRIGIVLEEPITNQEEIIRLAEEQVNEQADILPEIRFEYISEKVPRGQSFAAVQTVCSLAKRNVSCIISSTGCDTSKVIQSVCNDLKIPHLTVPKENCVIDKYNGFSLSIRPNSIHLDQVVLDVIRRLKWKELVIFYDSDTAYKNVEGLMSSATAVELVLEVILLRVTWNDTENVFEVRNSFSVALASKVRNYVVYCDNGNSFILLQQASAFGMTQRDHHWIITTQGLTPSPTRTASGRRGKPSEVKDIRNEDLNKLNKSSGIMAIIRQGVDVNYSSPSIREAWKALNPDFLPKMNYSYQTDNITSMTISPTIGPTTRPDTEFNLDSAYLYDAIKVTATAMNTSISSGTWSEPEGVTCYNSDNSKPWSSGDKVILSLQKVDVQGMMGRINFNGSYYNDHLVMEVLSLETRFDSTVAWKIGQWDPVHKLNLTYMPFRRGFNSRNYTIVTIEEAPFVMVEETVMGTKYTGFCIDMLNEIAAALGFNYTLYQVPDNKYGGENEDGTWHGLVGQVYHGHADLAVAGMIINSDREKVVDFTKPFMNYGVGILIRKPNKKSNVFAFLEPLNIWVWGCILAAFFIVGVLLYLLDRLSPYSNHNQRRQEHIHPHYTDDFDLKNSLWFTFASFMQQAAPWKVQGPSQEGGDTTPISFSGRILSAFWWFFALIVIATYTANLAAFLTVTRMANPIQSLEDLAYQQKVVYGTIEGSSLQKFFEKRAHVGIYERMWNFMTHVNPSPWVETDNQGYQRVKDEDYAFLWDAPILEYLKQTECELMTVGKPFNLKGYGIATPQGADYRDKISFHILQMQEQGKLEELRKKWFERESICPEDGQSAGRDTSDIGLETVAGVFYILIMGAAMSFVTVVVEHMWHRPSVYKKRCKSIKTKSKVNFQIVPQCKTTSV